MIRKIKPDDFDNVFGLTEEFHTEVMKDFDVEFDESTMRGRVKTFTDNSPDTCCFVAEKDNKIIGFLGGVIMGLMFNRNVSAFIECGYFIKKEHRKSDYGLRLIRQAINYCKENKIQKFMIGNTGMVNIQRYRNFYERLGFKLFEQYFMKTI